MDAGLVALLTLAATFVASLLPTRSLRPLRAGAPCPVACSSGCARCGRGPSGA